MTMTEKGLLCPVKRIRTDVVCRITPEQMVQPYYKTKYRRINPKNKRCLRHALGYEEIQAYPGCKWVTDFLEHEEWLPGEFIFLEAGTGTGKNTFVENLVAAGCSRICILSNRKVNKEQLAERLKIRHNNFHFSRTVLLSYQQIESNPSIGSAELEAFDIIVCDESHYWQTDSSYNNRTQVSLEKILGTQRPIKLFMSATLDEIRTYIINRLRKDSNRPIDPMFYCKSYVLTYNCFNFSAVHSVDWEHILKSIKKSEFRWLCFVDSKAKGSWLQAQLGNDAVFVDSEGSMGNGKVAGEVEYIIKNEAFRPKVLITTSILDNGVNLKMTDLGAIVIECNNKNQIIQMMGRKRPINEDDCADLYLIHQPQKKLLEQLRRLESDYAGYIAFQNELETYGWPSIMFSQNSPESDQYRNRMTWSETEKRFHFNYLGFLEIKMRRKQMKELINAEDPFLHKLRWIFKTSSPPVGITMEQIVYNRNQSLLEILLKYAGEPLQIKSDKVVALRQEFTKAYLRINGTDASKGYRSNRFLSIPQIKEIALNSEFPVTVQTVDIKRKKHLVINRLS